ncbi:RnfABCDGE type electron transport complex subunit D [Thermodesulforhabdus norvegica]|uniref:Ion-translocating oxidoreductase complex subunit D n=1 Tax=Thermodesulforhabdus norvegica TaxID=39841 RepID=A0A1I4RA08_9BACT|nr:RnfABCDGE type electron transport complex subunit D [Thermodesulforhabdus norvegica]SFM49081.1 electron transport complex protein RnfD [Thermodesulforhabdus norvegica]
MKKGTFIVSPPPHVHSGWSVCRVHCETVLALVPTILAGIYFFGFGVLKPIVAAVVGTVLAEAVWQKAIKRPVTVSDGSAVLTGVLLGLLISPSVPWWIPFIGGVIGILVPKQFFGGVGQNAFSTVLVGWAVMYVSYQSIMADYPMPAPLFGLTPGGYVEYPPTEVLKWDGVEVVRDIPLVDLFIGNVPGTAGTTSVLAVLIGGIYLILRGIIPWQIPVFYLIGAAGFELIFWMINPAKYASPIFHLFSGWMMLGAFFLSTEKGTTPLKPAPMVLYGLGCGIMTMIIRNWGVYVDGVPFAILFMNAVAPLLDRMKTKPIGRVEGLA